MYYLYLLRCADGSLYTGITLDVARRVREHNTLKLGAKYTRGRRPVRLVAKKHYRTLSKVLKAEALVKRLPRDKKLGFIRKS